jgi:hypothetical protein
MGVAIAVVVAGLVALALLYRFRPKKTTHTFTQAPLSDDHIQVAEGGIPVSAIAPLFEPEPDLGGTTIYRTPATRVLQNGSAHETTIRIKDAGSGWVVVWDDHAGILDNLIIAGGKAEVTLEEGQLRLVPCGAGVGYIVSKSHETPEPLEVMFERLRRIEIAAA